MGGKYIAIFAILEISVLVMLISRFLLGLVQVMLVSRYLIPVKHITVFAFQRAF